MFPMKLDLLGNNCLSTHWVLKENKIIVPKFSASISLPSSGECAWADVTHRHTFPCRWQRDDRWKFGNNYFVFFQDSGFIIKTIVFLHTESNNLFSRRSTCFVSHINTLMHNWISDFPNFARLLVSPNMHISSWSWRAYSINGNLSCNMYCPPFCPCNYDDRQGAPILDMIRLYLFYI